jgi:tetratricopeptide (TPR) repeat protein
LLIYLTVQIISFFKFKEKLSSLIRITIIAVIILSSLLALFVTNEFLVKHSEDSDYGAIYERVKTINFNNSSGRILYWAEGLKLFKDNFILGVGEGNFKIDFLKYRNKKLTDSLVYPRRLHNDFLEVAIETGILGGLCYISIFFFFLLSFIRTLKKKDASFTKGPAFFSFLAAAVYAVDAFFNFPMERSNMQVYFGLFLAISVISHIGFKDKEDNTPEVKWPPIIWIPVITILLSICYINFIALKSSAFQAKYLKDMENLTQKADDVARHFPLFPTIDFTGQSIRSIKATYYAKEKRFQEALDVLNKGKNPSPYFLAEDLLKVDIYTEMGQLDTAMHYALIGSKKGPKFYPFINNVIQIALKKGDIEAALSAADNYTRSNPYYSLAWINYAELVSMKSHDFNKVHKVLKSALQWSPRNKMLLEKWLSFIMSIEDNPKKLAELQNYTFYCATIACKQGDFHTAIKHLSPLINLPEYNNGQAEFFRGVCFLKVGQKEKACADFRTSVQKKYFEAQEYLEQCSP